MKLGINTNTILAKLLSLAHGCSNKLDSVFIVYGTTSFFVLFIYLYIVDYWEDSLGFAVSHAPWFITYYVFNILSISL